MSKLKTMLLVSVAALALSAGAASAASAHEFIASKAGNLLGGGLGNQEFVLKSGATTSCEEASVTGKSASGAQKALVETITFNGETCSNIGFSKISPMELEINAEGTAKLLNTVTFEARSGGLRCYLTLPAKENEKLTGMKYSNGASKVEESSGVTFTGESTGGCQPVGPKGAATLTWKGLLNVGLEGGTLQYK
jgi:hypothetical protein